MNKSEKGNGEPVEEWGGKEKGKRKKKEKKVKYVYMHMPKVTVSCVNCQHILMKCLKKKDEISSQKIKGWNVSQRALLCSFPTTTKNKYKNPQIPTILHIKVLAANKIPPLIGA